MLFKIYIRHLSIRFIVLNSGFNGGFSLFQLAWGRLQPGQVTRKKQTLIHTQDQGREALVLGAH